MDQGSYVREIDIYANNVVVNRDTGEVVKPENVKQSSVINIGGAMVSKDRKGFVFADGFGLVAGESKSQGQTQNDQDSK